MSKADKDTKKEKKKRKDPGPVEPNAQGPVNPDGQDPAKPDAQGPVNPDGQGPAKLDGQDPIKPDAQENRTAKPVENPPKKSADTVITEVKALIEPHGQEMTKKVIEALKIDKPKNDPWLTRKTAGTAVIASFFVGGWFLGSDSGFSQKDIDKALAEQAKGHTTILTDFKNAHDKAIADKDAIIINTQNQLAQAQANTLTIVEEPLSPRTTVQIRTDKDGYRKIMGPLGYFTAQTEPQLQNLCAEALDNAPHTIGPREITAFEGSASYGIPGPGNIFVGQVISARLNSFCEDPKGKAALLKGIGLAKDYIRSNPQDPNRTNVLRFEHVAAQSSTQPDETVIYIDIDGDDKANSGPKDMSVIANFVMP